MAGERTKLIVTKREHLGSRETRRLRKEGLVPGVLYGANEPVAIAVAERELRRALTGAGGLHSILDVEIDGESKTHPSILKEYQVNKVRGGVTHVDLHEVRLDRTIHASVTVHLMGGERAPGVKEGGVLSQPLRELNVEALPLEVPEHIELDVSHLSIGDSLRVADIVVPDGVIAARRPGDRPRKRHRADPCHRGRGRRGRRGCRGRDARGRGAGRRIGSRRRLLLRRGLGHAALAAASGLLARPAGRRARQSRPRIRAEPPQRRRDGRRRARAPPRRLVALEVLRPARRDPPRGRTRSRS